MNLFNTIWRSLRSLGQTKGVKQEIDEELRFHIEQRTVENIAKGMSPEDAAREARKRFGNVQSVREECRDVRGTSFGEAAFRDIRFGFRMLWKNPGFTAVAVLTLALGIGANTAIFSFVNAILLRPLPFKQPDRLLMVFENKIDRGFHKFEIGAPVLDEWRKQNTIFEGLAARHDTGFVLTGSEEPENLTGSELSANLFSLLGIKPILGRDFLPEEETYGRHHVVLLSYELWQRRFGREANIVGRSITLDAQPYTVIGVMPSGTHFPTANAQLWTPLAFSPDQLRNRHAHRYLVYARLKPHVTLAAARTEMDVIARRMAVADERNKGWGAEVYPLQEIMVGDYRAVLPILLGAVGFVLLIGCVNIANLLLARSASRHREFAIRTALGAGRGQIIRQLLTESWLLAVVGGSAGTLLAFFFLKALVRISPPDLPRISEGIHLDAWSLAFTALVTCVTGLIFGLFPAWQAAKPALASDMNESSRGSSSGRQRQRIRGALVVSEVAISLMLLIGAGLMIRSFGRLLSEPPGFNPEHLISMNLVLPGSKFPDQAGRMRFFETFLNNVQAMPGVQSAALIKGLPLSGDDTQVFLTVKDAPPPAPGEAVSAGYSLVSPGYFHAMNIPLLQGRDFTEQDRSSSVPVLIVDEALVKNFKLGTNVLGRRVSVGDGTDNVEIVGVVKDVKRIGMADEPRGEMYRTYNQMCMGSMSLVVRTQRDPAEITRAIRGEALAVDKDQPVENIRTMTQLVASSVAQRRLSMQLLGGFAGVAMLLASIGLYGLLTYNVTQRTQEIGIRMALGAQPDNVLSLVLRQGMKLVLLGVGIGLVAALALTRVIRSLLYQVQPTDPATFFLVSLLLIIVGLLACWLPARRAAKVDPMEALRHE